MNLFCFSLEGSMDSLYEPIPEQANQEGTSGRSGSPMSPLGDSGQAHDSLFMEVSNLDNIKPKKRKSFRRFMSENKIFEGKTVNDTIWQEPSKPETDSHIERPCQLNDPNEEVFFSSNNIDILQEKNPQGTSDQVIKSGDDPVESMGTLRRLQKLVWTKKARVQSLDEGKPTLTNPQDEDDTLISCLKLTKSQEKKFNNISPKSKEEIDIRLNSFSASLDRSSTSNSCNLEDILYHNDDEVQMWHTWKTFPENPLWTSIDFQIAQVGTWGNCSSCTHLPHLKSSYTDLDLLHSWDAGISSSLWRDLMDLRHFE